MLVYTRSADLVTLLYARRAPGDDEGRLYFRFSFIHFSGGAWTATHLATIETTDEGGFEFRRGNQLVWSSPNADSYTSCVLGAGRVTGGTLSSFRSVEVPFDSADVGPDTDATAVRGLLASNWPSDVFFVLAFNAGEAWNDRYRPVYGGYAPTGPNGSDGPPSPPRSTPPRCSAPRAPPTTRRCTWTCCWPRRDPGERRLDPRHVRRLDHTVVIPGQPVVGRGRWGSLRAGGGPLLAGDARGVGMPRINHPAYARAAALLLVCVALFGPAHAADPVSSVDAEGACWRSRRGRPGSRWSRRSACSATAAPAAR
ncbi:MAG: hypothetical protein GY898_16045 [Proteobacteria bacterium]|nr:hypothetical protein [Pseudomonadota bacterium]